MLEEFEIYYDDLTEDCKKRLKDFLESKDGEDNNWEFSPITSICLELDDPKVEDLIQ